MRVLTNETIRAIPQSVAEKETRSGTSPWLQLQVQVVNGPYKGNLATITDVLIGQNTKSGLIVQVKIDTIGRQATAYGPIIDYEHVMTR